MKIRILVPFRNGPFNSFLYYLLSSCPIYCSSIILDLKQDSGNNKRWHLHRKASVPLNREVIFWYIFDFLLLYLWVYKFCVLDIGTRSCNRLNEYFSYWLGYFSLIPYLLSILSFTILSGFGAHGNKPIYLSFF
jgi:hypothetical protein